MSLDGNNGGSMYSTSAHHPARFHFVGDHVPDQGTTTLNEKSNGSAQVREKALRSKKLYWVVGTVVIALVLLTLYSSVYVSAQQAYYNERAFRLHTGIWLWVSGTDSWRSRVKG